MNSNNTAPSIKGIQLLRDHLLPNLLSEDEADILYWAGKELARSYTFSSFEAIRDTMEDVSLGTVKLIKEKRNTYQFHLTGQIVTERLNASDKATFSLETGFLAEAVQHVTDYYTEGTYEIYSKKGYVAIHLQVDKKESIS